MEIDCRLRIKHIVSLQPGVHLRELQRLLGLSFSSIRYHVEKMAKSGEIARIEDGGYSRLFPARMGNEDTILLSAMRRSSDRRILSSLLSHGSLSQKEMCGITRLAKSTVSEVLSHLLEQGVIRIGPPLEARTYEVMNPARVNMLMNAHMGLFGKATARFIDVWDF